MLFRKMVLAGPGMLVPLSTTLLSTEMRMRNALDYGTRTVMLRESRVAFDIADDRCRKMDAPDLLHLFATMRASPWPMTAYCSVNAIASGLGSGGGKNAA